MSDVLITSSANELLRPQFLDTKMIDVIVATSGYCNARCEECIWPYMKNNPKTMSDSEFEALLKQFEGYNIEEFALNIINEPFIDKQIGNKIEALMESGLPIKVLFFSSNWLIPSAATVREFAKQLHAAAESSSIGRVDVNATISGTTPEEYDRYQAGRDLQDTIAQYRPLDFERAVDTVLEFVEAIDNLGWPDGKLIVRFKAYGKTFTQKEYSDFWLARLRARNIEELALQKRIHFLVNHGYTTFARCTQIDDRRGTHRCSTHWLDKRIAIGPAGEVGLCCEDGLRSVTLGNIFEQGLDGVVASAKFQQHLAVVLGQATPSADSPCRQCQFYLPT